MSTAITQTETLLPTRVEDTITKLKGGCELLDILPRRPTVVEDSSPDIIIPHSCSVDSTTSSCAACSDHSCATESSESQVSPALRDPCALAGTLLLIQGPPDVI